MGPEPGRAKLRPVIDAKQEHQSKMVVAGVAGWCEQTCAVLQRLPNSLPPASGVPACGCVVLKWCTAHRQGTVTAAVMKGGFKALKCRVWLC